MRRQSQESLETVKKDIEHPHFQQAITTLKDYKNYFYLRGEDGKWAARDDADHCYILRMLQNPNDAAFSQKRNRGYC